MKPAERVEKTIRGEPVDRVPRGELTIDPQFCCRVMGTGSFSFAAALSFWELLQLDLVVLAPPHEQISVTMPGGHNLSEQIIRWRRESEYYVFALVNGGFSRILATRGFQPFMHALFREKNGLQQEICRHFEAAAADGREAVSAGAHGVIIADDIAYNKSTFLSPSQLEELYFPALKKMVQEMKTKTTVFFHSDGNLNKVLPQLSASGIDGLQCLEPAAGMDLASVKAAYGEKLCLMGNLDLSLLDPSVPDEKLRQAVYRIVQTGKKGGRYIFGTCSGLHGDLNVEKVLAMYRYALEADEQTGFPQ